MIPIGMKGVIACAGVLLRKGKGKQSDNCAAMPGGWIHMDRAQGAAQPAEPEEVSAPIAPSVTRADVEANIASEHYFTAADGVHYQNQRIQPIAELSLLTFCVLVLRNGPTVTGESSCPSLLLFNTERGRAVARKKAIRKLTEMMDGELMRQLAEMSECVDLVDSWAGVKPVK